MLHQFKYAFTSILREKEVLFWNLLFPIALVTFMFLAFGNLYEKDLQFHPVKVAVIEEEENSYFAEVLDSLSEKGDDQTLKIVSVKEKGRKATQKI